MNRFDGKYFTATEAADVRHEVELEIDDARFRLSHLTSEEGCVTTVGYAGVWSQRADVLTLSANRRWSLVRQLLLDDIECAAESNAEFEVTNVDGRMRIDFDGALWDLQRVRRMNAAATPEAVLASWAMQIPGVDGRSVRVVDRVERGPNVSIYFLATSLREGPFLGHAVLRTGQPLLRLARAEICTLAPFGPIAPSSALEDALDRFARARRRDSLTDVRIRVCVPFLEHTLALVDLRYELQVARSEEERWTEVAALVTLSDGGVSVTAQWELGRDQRESDGPRPMDST